MTSRTSNAHLTTRLLTTSQANPRPAVRRVQLSRFGHRSDSDRPAIRRGPTIARWSASAPSALAFGRVASVLQSIERLLAIMGDATGRVRPALRPAARRPGFRGLRAPLDAGRRSGGAGVDPAADARSSRIDRRVLRRRATTRPRRTSARRSTASRRGRWRSTSAPRTAACRGGPASATSFRVPRPAARCKRLNLFLRWMVRRDALDLGVWSRVPRRRSSCRSTRT